MTRIKELRITIELDEDGNAVANTHANRQDTMQIFPFREWSRFKNIDEAVAHYVDHYTKQGYTVERFQTAESNGQAAATGVVKKVFG